MSRRFARVAPYRPRRAVSPRVLATRRRCPHAESFFVASVVRRVGQERYGRETKHGRERSGVAAAERAEAAKQQEAAAQAAADRQPYAVVPAERLGNLGIDKLQAIFVRCEGGKVGKLPPSKVGDWCGFG